MCIAKCLKEEQEHKPEECTPEQIRECHGEVAEHACISGGTEK